MSTSGGLFPLLNADDPGQRTSWSPAGAFGSDRGRYRRIISEIFRDTISQVLCVNVFFVTCRLKRVHRPNGGCLPLHFRTTCYVRSIPYTTKTAELKCAARRQTHSKANLTFCIFPTKQHQQNTKC